MTYPLPEPPALAEVAARRQRSGHWALVVDDRWRLVFATDALRLTFGAFEGLAPFAGGEHFFGPEATRVALGWRMGLRTTELYRENSHRMKRLRPSLCPAARVWSGHVATDAPGLRLTPQQTSDGRRLQPGADPVRPSHRQLPGCPPTRRRRVHRGRGRSVRRVRVPAPARRSRYRRRLPTPPLLQVGDPARARARLGPPPTRPPRPAPRGRGHPRRVTPAPADPRTGRTR